MVAIHGAGRTPRTGRGRNVFALCEIYGALAPSAEDSASHLAGGPPCTAGDAADAARAPAARPHAPQLGRGSHPRESPREQGPHGLYRGVRLWKLQRLGGNSIFSTFCNPAKFDRETAARALPSWPASRSVAPGGRPTPARERAAGWREREVEDVVQSPLHWELSIRWKDRQSSPMGADRTVRDVLPSLRRARSSTLPVIRTVSQKAKQSHRCQTPLVTVRI